MEKAELAKVESGKVKEFFKRYWPLLAVGGFTAVGVGVWMTVRYIKEHQERQATIDVALWERLERLEREALAKTGDSAKLIETTGGLAREVGSERVAEVARSLAIEVEDEEIREILETVADISRHER